jgi:hypothetical protein
VIVPTLLFAFLSRELVPILIVTVIAGGLWWAKSQPIPATAPPLVRGLQPFLPYAPALQVAVVFAMLGGSIVVVVVIAAAVAAAARFRHAVVAALEPWWRLQGSIPPAARKALAFAIPAAVGYYFGVRAGGREWSYTLISISCGAAIAFLLLFTPPDWLRRRKLT